MKECRHPYHDAGSSQSIDAASQLAEVLVDLPHVLRETLELLLLRLTMHHADIHHHDHNITNTMRSTSYS